MLLGFVYADYKSALSIVRDALRNIPNSGNSGNTKESYDCYWALLMRITNLPAVGRSALSIVRDALGNIPNSGYSGYLKLSG